MAVTAMGMEALIVPLFEVVPISWRAPDPEAFDAVAMTSANAARHGGDNLALFTQLPVFAVGEATADAARLAGFTTVQVGVGDAADLGALLNQPFPFRGRASVRPSKISNFGSGSLLNLVRNVESLRVLHLAGTHHKDISTRADVTVVPVYATNELTISVPLHADIALIHSPRAGARVAELIPDRACLQIIAISEAAGRACGSGWAAVHIAAVPREHAMLECLRGLCEASPRN